MRRPPLQTGRVVAGTVLLALLSYTTPALAQQPGGIEELGASIFVQAIVAALITLVVGGGWILLAEEYTTRTTDRILENPGETFLYGLGISIALFVVVVLLAITIVGILLVIPLLIAVIILAELGYLATGRAVGDDWALVLAVAIAVSAFVGGIPFLGGLVGFIISCMAFGAVYFEYKADGEEPSGGKAPSDPSISDRAGSTSGTPGQDVNPLRPGTDSQTTNRPTETAGADDGSSVNPGVPEHELGENETDAEQSTDTPDWKDESVSDWDWGMDDEAEADDSESETDESERSDDR